MTAMDDTRRDYHVRALPDVPFERWFDVGNTFQNVPQAVARLRATLEGDGLKLHFRLVALDGGQQVRAKVGGYVTSSGRLTFWAVYHRDGESEWTKSVLTGLLVDECVARARSTSSIRYVETQPAHDTPELPTFLDAIRSAGLLPVAASRCYEWDSGREPRLTPRLPLSDLRLVPCWQLAPEILARAFEKVRRRTDDRSERDSPLSPEQTLEELRSLAGDTAETSLWSVGMLGDSPIGYVLCSLSEAHAGEPRKGMILEIGVVEEERQKGIGTWMAWQALQDLMDRGAKTVRSLVDDINTPSLRLHSALDFVPLPGTYWTWRLVL